MSFHPNDFGLALGWSAAALLAAHAFYSSGLIGMVCALLFFAGTVIAIIRVYDVHERLAHARRLLRKHGIDPTERA